MTASVRSVGSDLNLQTTGCEMLFISSLPLFSQEDQTSEIKVIDYDVTLVICRSIRELEALSVSPWENAALSARGSNNRFSEISYSSSPVLFVSQLAAG